MKTWVATMMLDGRFGLFKSYLKRVTFGANGFCGSHSILSTFIIFKFLKAQLEEWSEYSLCLQFWSVNDDSHSFLEKIFFIKLNVLHFVISEYFPRTFPEVYFEWFFQCAVCGVDWDLGEQCEWGVYWTTMWYCSECPVDNKPQ